MSDVALERMAPDSTQKKPIVCFEELNVITTCIRRQCFILSSAQVFHSSTLTCPG